MQDYAIGLGHNNPPAAAVTPSWLAGRRAIIRRRKRPVETAGRAHENEWVLTFERCTPPEIDVLMGWTGGDDTLATEVRLTFATRAEAVAYAERQGLAYDAEPEPARVSQVRPVQHWRWDRAPASSWGRPLGVPLRNSPRQAQNDGGHQRAGLPDLERALINPAAVFAGPEEVVGHPRLMRECKREILRRWAWDEHLKEVAAAEGMSEGEPSRLDEVKAALLRLGETWRPKPFAPAAAVVPCQQGELELVAA
jgi:ETC complex I subunit conserved region